MAETRGKGSRPSGGPLFIRGYAAFERLCAANPDIFSMRQSPDVAQLVAFHEEFARIDYVRALFGKGSLRDALDALERGFHHHITCPLADVLSEGERQELRAHKRLEREVRFIHRFATLVGSGEGQLTFGTPRVQAEQRKRRRHLRKCIAAVATDLNFLLRDEFFTESLAPKDLGALQRLRDDLPLALKCVERANPAYPATRSRDEGNTNARGMVNRLADACFRIDGYCDERIILLLSRYDELRYVSDHIKVDDLIETALTRKVDAFNRRQPNEDFLTASVYGDWVPAQTLEPPWMMA